MIANERLVTFVVRIVASSAGTHAVVERVKTGRKTRVDRLERLGEVIAALVAADDPSPRTDCLEDRREDAGA